MAGPLNLEQLLGFLLDTPMFGDLDPHELSEIVHTMQVQHIRGGQTIFEAGTAGDAWYIVYHGQVHVFGAGPDGEPRLLAELGPRTCFGEMAVLDGSPRSATVRAVSDATLLRFPRDAFEALLAENRLAAYKLVHQMAKVLVARQRRATAAISSMLADPPDQPGVVEGLAPLVEEASPSGVGRPRGPLSNSAVSTMRDGASGADGDRTHDL